MSNPTDPPIRLKGNYFARPDFFHTDVEKGVTRTPAGVRVCTLPSDFLLAFRDAAIYECGRAYRTVLKAAGKRWGIQFAKRLDKELTAYYGMPFRDLGTGLAHTCLADAFAAHGYGNLFIDLTHCTDGLILVELTDSVMPDLVRESDRPVDLLMCGLLASVFSHLSGQELDCVQTDCPTLGADRGRFVLGLAGPIGQASEWLEEADPFPGHDAILRRLLKPTVASTAVAAESTDATAEEPITTA